MHACSVGVQNTSSGHLGHVNQMFTICQVGIFNMLKLSSRYYVLQVFRLFTVRVWLCDVDVQVICCRRLQFVLQVFCYVLYMFRLLVVIYVICYRSLYCVLQVFRLFGVGVYTMYYKFYISTSVCKNTYYKQFKMLTLTIQNAYFSS